MKTLAVLVVTQSDLLAVNTGLPDQNSFTLSADNLNPEANSISGQTVNLVARLADTFNNPEPMVRRLVLPPKEGLLKQVVQLQMVLAVFVVTLN